MIWLYIGRRCISFKKSMNNNDPKHDPWAVPQLMSNMSDFTVLFSIVLILHTNE